MKFAKTKQHHLSSNQTGAVMVEYAILIPFLLFLTFSILQLSMLFVADSIMEYAAFSAARSERVRGVNIHDASNDVNPQKAAEMVCSLISFGEDPNSERINIPGWGTLKGSSYSQNNTIVEIENQDEQRFTATVTFYYKFLFPQMSLPFLSLTSIDYGAKTEDGKLILQKSCSMTRSFIDE